MSVLHCPEIFAIAAVAGISDPGYLLRIPHFGLAHPFQLEGKSLTAAWHRLEGHTQEAFTKSFPLGKGASRSLRSEFVDGIAVSAHVAHIHHKQIACAVKGQTLCAVGHGAKDRPTMPA